MVKKTQKTIFNVLSELIVKRNIKIDPHRINTTINKLLIKLIVF